MIVSSYPRARKKKMRVWTIQKPGMLETLEKTGVYRADTAKVLEDRILAPEVLLEDDYVIWSYRYMARQMVKRIGSPPPGVEFPVWVWVQWRGPDHPRPDLRVASHGPKGLEMVMIELEVNDSTVLVSDLSLWFFPFGGHYLPYPRGSEAEWNRVLKARGLKTRWGHDKNLPPDLQAMKEDSWEAVFNLGCRATSITDKASQKVFQGCLWEIRKDMIRGVKRFKCR
jgi:hypothetical protein